MSVRFGMSHPKLPASGIADWQSAVLFHLRYKVETFYITMPRTRIRCGKNLMRIYVKFGFGIIFALFSATLCLAQQPNGNEDVLKPVTVKTDLYPANADANKDIEEALKVAASTNKRVMLVFGGNWCYDCHVLDQALHEGDAGTIVKDHFLLVHVDIGEGNKNLDLVKKYETTLDFGVPTVVLLNGSGRVIYSSTKGEFEPARRMMKKDLVAFLNEWKSTVIVRP
jgi:thioredoxin-related protein